MEETRALFSRGGGSGPEERTILRGSEAALQTGRHIGLAGHQPPAQPRPIIGLMVKQYDPRFQFATVMVRDQDRSLRFYVDQLGFRLVADEQVPSGGRWTVVEPSDRS